MTDDEIDPEVLADLALRKVSERDSSRTRTAKYDWTPPVIVGQWRCRNEKCGVWVDVPEPAMERFCAFNQRLRSLGEATMDANKILFCGPCTIEYKRTAADRRRGQVERMRAAILELKKGVKPDREREILDQLKAWHHPDLPGLENWLRDRNRAGDGKRRREP